MSWLATFLPTTDDERIEVQLLIGEALLADKQYIEAIEELGDVLLVEPGKVRALRLLARAHAMEGHREDALSLFRALAEAVPRDAEASVHIGYEYALGSENELAQEAFRTAFRENFDYLLHDLTPYALALKEEGIELRSAQNHRRRREDAEHDTLTPEPRRLRGADRSPGPYHCRARDAGRGRMGADDGDDHHTNAFPPRAPERRQDPVPHHRGRGYRSRIGRLVLKQAH